jgi:hypothetical protein
MIPRTWRLKILNWLGAGYISVDRDEDYHAKEIALSPVRQPSVDIEGLSFNVMPAQGGVIVQLRKYDRKADRNDTATHIIPTGDDVAETIGKIVAMELWRA